MCAYVVATPLFKSKNKIYKLKQNHEKLTTIWNVQTKVQTNFYYHKVLKHKHKKNKTRLWNKIVPQIGVKKIEGNEGPTFIYTPLRT
jgi:hypothetical protein